MSLPNLGLRPSCYTELFWGWGLPLGISSSSPLSWSIEQCNVGTPWPEVVNHVIFPRESRAHVIASSYFAMGQSCPFLKILPQVRWGRWLRNHRPAKMGFLQSLTGRWSCRPRALLGGRLPTFLLGFWASSLGCTWLYYSLPWPTHWPKVVRLMKRLSWSRDRHRTLWTCRCRTEYHYWK